VFGPGIAPSGEQQLAASLLIFGLLAATAFCLLVLPKLIDLEEDLAAQRTMAEQVRQSSQEFAKQVVAQQIREQLERQQQSDPWRKWIDGP
jgi:hypothetical protein